MIERSLTSQTQGGVLLRVVAIVNDREEFDESNTREGEGHIALERWA